MQNSLSVPVAAFVSSVPPTATVAPPAAGSAASLAGYYPRRHWPQMLGMMTLLALGLSFAMCWKCAVWGEKFAVTFAYNFCYTVGLWLANSLPAEWLNRRSDWTQQPLRRFLLTIVCALLASLSVITAVSVGFRVFYWHRPVSSLSWDVFAFPLAMTVVVSLFMHSRSFLMGWRDAAVRAQRLEKESAVARLDSLRRQVDPHFLFNSLNALTSLVEENDPARAVRFIRQLSQVYRYVLDSESQELVPLADEVAFAESYLFLQKTRLGEALAVAMDLPPAALAPFFVPPLALQLLVENVIKHNTAFQTNPLHLRVTLDAAAGTLTVRNTLRPRRLAPGESSGRGLSNLAARYAFLTDRPLVAGPEAGEFVVTLPLLVI